MNLPRRLDLGDRHAGIDLAQDGGDELAALVRLDDERVGLEAPIERQGARRPGVRRQPLHGRIGEHVAGARLVDARRDDAAGVGVPRGRDRRVDRDDDARQRRRALDTAAPR